MYVVSKAFAVEQLLAIAFHLKNPEFPPFPPTSLVGMSAPPSAAAAAAAVTEPEEVISSCATTAGATGGALLLSITWSIKRASAGLAREHGPLNLFRVASVSCLVFCFHLQIARMVSALQQQQQRQPGMKHSPSHPVGPKPHIDSMVPNPLNVGLSDLQTKGQIPGYGSGKCSRETSN